MIETLILILKAVGLICLISLAVVVTLSIIVWIIWSVIDGIRYSDVNPYLQPILVFYYYGCTGI